MKNTLRTICISFALAITTVTASAAPASDEVAMLYKKAFYLAIESCRIYPALTDADVCMDKIVRKILTDRQIVNDKQDNVLKEQQRSYVHRFPESLIGTHMTRDRYDNQKLATRLIEVIDFTCAVPPAFDNIQLCMDAMYHSILSSRDPHSAYLSAKEAEEWTRGYEGRLEGIGIEVIPALDKSIGAFRIMEGSPAEISGIIAGDRIVAVINNQVRVATSSLPTPLEAINLIKGLPNTSVTLEILRGEEDQKLFITVVRAKIHVPMVKHEIVSWSGKADSKYGYIRITQFGTKVKDEIVTAVRGILSAHRNVKGLIFDLRGNPGGLVQEAYESVDAFVDTNEPLVSIRDNDGIHAWGTVSNERSPKPQPGDIAKGYPIAVLIDGSSASAAEIFSGALKEFNRSVTIGVGTWRKGSVQNVAPLPDGSMVKLTMAEYLIGSPTKWVAVQCVGVNPDIAYELDLIRQPSSEHECDLPGAIVSGGARSALSTALMSLDVRNPALYQFGLAALEAIKEVDLKTVLEFQRVKKLLKISDDVAPMP